MTTIGYIRVSSNKQTLEHQRFEIENFALKEGIKIDEWIEEKISSRKALDKLNFNTLYIDEVQRGLTALSDIITYQVDKKVKIAITTEAILNKIRITRKGWISSRGEGLKKISSTIKIEKNDDKANSFTAKRVDKPKSEVDALALADSKNRILGVSLKHINRFEQKNTQKYTAAAFTRH